MERTTLLHVVTHLGNEEMVRLLLEMGGERSIMIRPNYSYPLYDGGSMTPLHRAAEGGHIGIMKLFLAAGADISERDSHGGSAALEFAIEYGRTAAAEFIIRSGADVMAGCRQEPHITPLLRTCVRGNEYLASLLIESGARQDVHNSMRCAVGGKSLSMTQLLIDAGAHVGPEEMGLAVRSGNIEMLQFLKKNGGRFDNSVNNTILHYGNCSPGMAQAVLNEMPQSANTRDRAGLTPLDTIYRAALYDPDEDKITSKALYLIQAGGELNGLDIDYYMGRTTLQCAVSQGHERMVRMLLQLESQKPLLSTRDFDGRTALHYACYEDSPEYQTLVELLINAGIDVHINSNDGETPLHKAVSFCAFETIPLLLRAGIDVSHQNIAGETALHQLTIRAIKEHKRIQGFASLAGSIILGDVDVSIQDVGGERRLEPMMRSGYILAIRRLIDAGIDVSLHDNHGSTALDILARYRLLGARTPLYGNKTLEDMKGAGQTMENHAAIMEWISPIEDDDKPDGTDELEGFWDGVDRR